MNVPWLGVSAIHWRILRREGDMMDHIELMKKLHQKADTKLIMLVVDGIGGLPMNPEGLTELEAAFTPNLNQLAAESMCGMSTPVIPGITPGSGPGHLSLFGFDPLRHEIGRGVLEALGVGFELGRKDVAARVNFCTIDPATGLITDRRAGRIPTETGRRLVNILRRIALPGVEVFVEPVKEYRFVLVLRGPGLEDGLTETDPQQVGLAPLPVRALKPESEHTAELFNQWLAQAREILKDEFPANGCNLRGLAKDPGLPSYKEVYGLNAAAIATYPMYRGVARLLGMKVLNAGETIETEVDCLVTNWDKFDFFFVHIKKTDSAGEDGNFDKKVLVIEELDRFIPRLRALKPDVFLISGDHSTPSLLKSHSWHELPVLLHSSYIRRDRVQAFGERPCMEGGLGHLRHVNLMPLMMAHGLRLIKYGA
jgi:2,3-bisphosphoglycerate-independent phosphoglycerate mutase